MIFVVEPIVSLMMDQEENLSDEFGIDRSAYIAGTQSAEEKYNVLDEFKNGKYLFQKHIMLVIPTRTRLLTNHL